MRPLGDKPRRELWGRVGPSLRLSTQQGRAAPPLLETLRGQSDGPRAPEQQEHDHSDTEAFGIRHVLPLPRDKPTCSREAPSSLVRVGAPSAAEALIMASATPQAAGSTPGPRSRQWALRARCHNEAEGRSVDQWPAPCRRVSARCWDCDAANAPAAGEMMVGSVLPGVNRFFWKPSDRGGMRDTSARRRVARGHDGGHALFILQQSLWDAGHPLAFCRRRYTGFSRTDPPCNPPWRGLPLIGS